MGQALVLAKGNQLCYPLDETYPVDSIIHFSNNLAQNCLCSFSPHPKEKLIMVFLYQVVIIEVVEEEKDVTAVVVMVVVEVMAVGVVMVAVTIMVVTMGEIQVILQYLRSYK